MGEIKQIVCIDSLYPSGQDRPFLHRRICLFGPGKETFSSPYNKSFFLPRLFGQDCWKNEVKLKWIVPLASALKPQPCNWVLFVVILEVKLSFWFLLSIQMIQLLPGNILRVALYLLDSHFWMKGGNCLHCKSTAYCRIQFKLFG